MDGMGAVIKSKSEIFSGSNVPSGADASLTVTGAAKRQIRYARRIKSADRTADNRWILCFHFTFRPPGRLVD